MDLLSIIGVALALVSVTVTMTLDGGSVMSLVHFPAFLIVVGGTTGAILLQTPPRIFFRAFRMLPWVFFPPPYDAAKLVDWILDWAQIARREGVLALEPIANDERDSFLKEALNLVIDGIPAPTIRAILETRLHSREEYEMGAARVFEQMAGYAPTIGIIGAVLGLITTMSHLDDPASLGKGIATAFVATIYGVASANLFYLPIANKLRTVIRKGVRRQEIIVEGLLGIALSEPRLHLGMKLGSFMHEGEVETVAAADAGGEEGDDGGDQIAEDEFRDSPIDERKTA
ncbi:MAG TPA: flagellar motor protein [Stellaceae bacterium]|jgi:chemotaxis protein MotA|nr:flagellar motor protein [Stellaceae bacterium]